MAKTLPVRFLCHNRWSARPETLMYVPLLLALLFTFSLPARAQAQTRVRRIGFLGNSTPVLEENLIGPFRDGLRDLGYVEGKNIVIEYRWAAGKYERFPALIAESADSTQRSG